MKWLWDQKWKSMIQFEVSQVTTFKSQSQRKSSCGNPQSQKEIKWQQSTLCKLKLKKYISYLILSVGMPLYQERCYIGCQQSLNAQQRPKIQVRWVKHNIRTHHISLNQGKPVWRLTLKQGWLVPTGIITGVIIEVIMHNTSHTIIKHMKYFES
jgi:hypothetical protein